MNAIVIAIGLVILTGCGKEVANQAATSQTDTPKQETATNGPPDSASTNQTMVRPSTPAANRPLTTDQAKQLVRDSILAFHDGIRSNDAATRRAAFDAQAPTKVQLAVLFGPQDADILWHLLEPNLARLRDNTDKLKIESDRHGAIGNVEVIDFRSNDSSGRYKDVLNAIPTTIPIFRAVTKYEKTTAGSSSYLVIEGRVVYIQGLEGMHESVRAQRKSK